MKLKIISKVASKVTPKIGRAALKIRKASPEILLVCGIGAGIACVVYACKGTLKMEEVLDKHKEKINEINDDAIIETERKRLVTRTYLETGMDLAKLYLPSVALGAFSMACVAGSHNIMTRRVAGLTAAYTALDEAFGSYRKRVVDKYGENEDYILYHGIEKEENYKTVEDGQEVVVNSVTLDKYGYSPYAKFFDQSCGAWEKDPSYNLYWLQIQEESFTNLLIARGHVFLNEVYDALGIERTPQGSVVGWLKDAGDNYVSFGIFDRCKEANRRFVNGLENVLLLDFNVDGVIYDKI